MSTKDFIKKQIKEFTVSDFYDKFIELSEVDCSLVVLEIASNDYTLTGIAHIVESNDARITNLSVLPIPGRNTFWVSVKTNVMDISSIMRSFERFNYKIIFYHMEDGQLNETQREHLEELLYYLNM